MDDVLCVGMVGMSSLMFFKRKRTEQKPLVKKLTLVDSGPLLTYLSSYKLLSKAKKIKNDFWITW